MNKKQSFKKYRPDEYRDLREYATRIMHERECNINLGGKHITVTINDPLNDMMVQQEVVEYDVDSIEVIQGFLDEMAGVERTIYLPHYLGMRPILPHDVVMTYNESGVTLSREEERYHFKYNLDDFKQCGDIINGLYLEANLNKKESCTGKCKDHGHCHECQIQDCDEGPSFEKRIWGQLSPKRQKIFLDLLSAEERAIFEKRIGEA